MINEIPTEMMPEMFVVPITVPPVTYAKVVIQGDNITIEPRLQTNGDRVRAKTDEELATWIYMNRWNDIESLLEWLKQEAK